MLGGHYPYLNPHIAEHRNLRSQREKRWAGKSLSPRVLTAGLSKDWWPRGPWMRSFWARGTESWSQLSCSFERRLEWKTVLDEDKKVTTPKSLLKKPWKIGSKRNQSQKQGVGSKQCWWAGVPVCMWAQPNSSCCVE